MEIVAALKVIRAEQVPQELWRIAADLKDPEEVRRVYATSSIFDGWSRGKAAAFADLDAAHMICVRIAVSLVNQVEFPSSR